MSYNKKITDLEATIKQAQLQIEKLKEIESRDRVFGFFA